MLLSFFAALMGSALLGATIYYLELIPWRRTADAHWTVRTRELFAVRLAAAFNPILLPLLCVLVGWIGWRAPWLPLALGGFLGAKLAGYPCDREVAPEVSGKDWLHLVSSALIFGSLGWIALGATIAVMPPAFGAAGWAITIGYLIIHVLIASGRSLVLLQWLHLLGPASLRVQQIVAEASATTGVPVRKVWELRVPVANALALTATGELAFTRLLSDNAPDDELRAICVHELGHLAESRWVLYGRILGSMSLVPLIFLRPAHAHSPMSGVQFLLVACAIIWWLGVRLQRAMEKRADQFALKASPEPAVYARALERLYRLNRMPAVQPGNNASHPHLYDRMLAAGVTPDYARPEPPSSVAASTVVLAFICGGLGVLIAIG